jgi:hypothetical protein
MARAARFIANQSTPIFLFNFMKKPYNLRAGFAQRLRQLGLTALLAGGATVAAHAQLGYVASSAVNTTGTYTDLGTSGTAITTANTDDANSAAQNIGFTFTYNGAAFTQFVFNTNGVVRLGSAAPSTAALYFDNNSTSTATDPLQSTSTNDVNLLMPFNQDLVPGSNAAGVDYRVLTSGTAPNRVCTIQWRNVADKAGAGSDVANGTQFANFSFQIKLYETTNNIEFIYDQAVAGTAAAGTRFPNVGLKGAGLAFGQLTLAQKAATTAWSATTFQNINYGSSDHDITRSVGPDVGRTYRFIPIANDIIVRAVYALGKVATPNAVPQAVRVFIANSGTTAQANVAITLTISGANTYTYTATVASLAAGAGGTLTFPAAPATLAAGTNTITVSVPNDGDNSNNSVATTQLVTTNRLSHITPNVPLDGALSGSSIASGSVLTAKYTVPTANTVYLSEALISFATGTGGPTTAFQVVVQDATGANGTPGAVLYTSATQNRPTAGGDVAVAIPSLALSGAFFVGVKEVGTTGAAIATQSEVPLRNTTFYYSPSGAAPWSDIAGFTGFGRLAIEVGLSAAPNCVAPTALAVSNTTATGATVTFTPVASGVASYQVIYGPTGFNPATGGTTITTTTSPVALTGLTPATGYQVYVRSNCTSGGTSVFTAVASLFTLCDPNTSVTSFPYTQTFDTVVPGQTAPCGITTLDANSDGTTWRISNEAPNSGTNSMRYQGSVVNNVAANDWFFSPALVLPGTANTRYQVAFRYRAAGVGSTGTSNYTESLEVKSGTATTAAGQTNLLYTNASINNLAYNLANGSSTPVVAYLPAGASTQYVGFHVISAANQGNLYIDDLSVTAVTVTGTSEALLRAVNVFPNPSATGVFNLAINGANAKQALEVEVTNNLGQRVYVGSARDNFTSQLDLSRLATGLYHLKVKNGDEYMLRQISVVK